MLKAVIPAGGLGTRLLPATREQPKEMLPVFARDRRNNLSVIPLVQLIFEQLFMVGVREFCFIVGRENRVLEDHFTPHRDYVSRLNERGRKDEAGDLERFYRQVKASKIVWANQSEPLGFGHAVQQARSFTGNDSFLVHAGDTHVASKKPVAVERIIKEHTNSGGINTILLLQEVDDPRRYGVAEIDRNYDPYVVRRVVEKPTKPKSKLAILPIYVFGASIYEALDHVSPDKRNEIQLTNAIQGLIDTDGNVLAIKLRRGDIWIDIGTPENYWEALELSHRYVKRP